MSLRLRLVLTYCALVVIIVAVFAGILYSTMRSSLQAEMDWRLHVRASQVELTLWPGTTSLTAQDITSATLDLSPLAELDAPGVYVQVLDREAHVVARSTNLGATDLRSRSRRSPARSTARPLCDRQRRQRPQRAHLEPADRESGGRRRRPEVGQSRQPLQQTLSAPHASCCSSARSCCWSALRSFGS